MINTVGITALYKALTDVISDKLDVLYSADKIDAETYAKITAQSFDDALKLAVSAVQQQEQIEKDASVKDAQIQLTNQQKANLLLEADNIAKQGTLIDAQALNTSKQAGIAEKEILVKTEQVLIAKEEVKIATAKLANIPKEGVMLDKQAAQITQQTLNLVSEELGIDAKTALTTQQKTNLVAEAINIPKQGTVFDKQASEIEAKTAYSNKQALHVAQQTTNLVAEELNIPKQGKVLDATECKLKAEYDVLLLQKTKTTAETTLLTQKVATEKAQISQTGVDDNSVVGRQKSLYLAQTNGIARDAEQKAADLMIKTWMTRRTTNDTETVEGTGLDNPGIQQVVAKMKSGIGL